MEEKVEEIVLLYVVFANTNKWNKVELLNIFICKYLPINGRKLKKIVF
jgi:hypothetical protein